MSSAGKKLQDIFDAGSSKLSELERSQLTALKSTTDGHLSEAKAYRKTAGEQTEQRSTELQSDIESHLAKTIQKIQKSIEHENQDVEKHLKSLLEKASLLTRRLQDSVNELRESHEFRISSLSDDSCDSYEREFEATTTEIRRQDYESSQNLKVQNRFVMNSFQQKLDHSLVETRGEERQISSKLFKAFLHHTNAVDAHVASLGQKLSSEYKSHADTLASMSKAGEEELQTHMESLVADAEQYALEIEQKIREFFEQIDADTTTGAAASVRSVTEELQSLHQTSREGLIKLCGDSQSSVQTVGDSAKESLTKMGQEASSKADTTLESFTAESNKRLDASLDLYRDLDSKRGQIIDQIKKDLVALSGSFDERMKAAEEKAMKELSTVSQEAEQEITEGQQAAVAQLKELANSAKNQIQNTMTEFLSRLQDKRHSAIDEVMRAAGGSIPNPAPAENQPEAPRKSKKVKKSDDKDSSSEDNSTSKSRGESSAEGD